MAPYKQDESQCLVLLLCTHPKLSEQLTKHVCRYVRMWFLRGVRELEEDVNILSVRKDGASIS